MEWVFERKVKSRRWRGKGEGGEKGEGVFEWVF